MLDENFPSYHFQRSVTDPLQNILFFTHNGSDPSPEYLIKRPHPASSRNQYALALFDAHYSSVIYGEVLVQPEWTQPTLSAAEVNSGGQNGPAPITPDSFSVLLYNPDQSIAVRKLQGGLARLDYWAFEIPERTFKLPSASQLDREAPNSHLSELSPKTVFHWKRDGRLSRDLTCYMTGKSVGGKKSKEPDITIAMFRAGKNGGVVTIYEPNMARVEIEDRKGLEVVLLLSAVVVRDLYVSPRQDVYNASAAGGPGPVTNRAQRDAQQSGSGPNETTMSGALEDKQTSIDAETKRLRSMVAEEERRRERINREEEEKTRRMLEQEEEMRRKRQAEVERETERLRRQYGMPTPSQQQQRSSNSPASPPLPQRRPVSTAPSMSGALGPSPSRQASAGARFYGPPGGSAISPPTRPHTVAPHPLGQQATSPSSSSSSAAAAQQSSSHDPGRRPFGNALGLLRPNKPYGHLHAAASVSNFFAGNKSETERKKMKKKQSVLF